MPPVGSIIIDIEGASNNEEITTNSPTIVFCAFAFGLWNPCRQLQTEPKHGA
jgi:hypothetical protein